MARCASARKIPASSFLPASAKRNTAPLGVDERAQVESCASSGVCRYGCVETAPKLGTRKKPARPVATSAAALQRILRASVQAAAQAAAIRTVITAARFQAGSQFACVFTGIMYAAANQGTA